MLESPFCLGLINLRIFSALLPHISGIDDISALFGDSDPLSLTDVGGADTAHGGSSGHLLSLDLCPTLCPLPGTLQEIDE